MTNPRMPSPLFGHIDSSILGYTLVELEAMDADGLDAAYVDTLNRVIDLAEQVSQAFGSVMGEAELKSLREVARMGRQ